MNNFKLKNIKRDPYSALKMVACDLLDKVSRKTNKGLKYDVNRLKIVVDLIERKENARKPLPEAPTVKELRQSGFKVRITELRYIHFYQYTIWRDKLFPTNEKAELSRNPKGGRTIVEITTPDGKELKGIANCSRIDSFCRAYGRNLAIHKALNGA